MAEEIMMPKLAMSMKQGKVMEWKVKEGEWIEKGQIVMVIETEKVTYECESPGSGYLHILVELDKEVPINDVVAVLAATPEELAEIQAKQPAPVELAAAEEAPVAAVGPTQVRPERKGKVKISPTAKKMAEQHNLDFAKIAGTGPDGRIVKQDVKRALEAREAGIEAEEEMVPAESIDGKRVKISIPMKGMRKAIADHMHQSLTVSAQLSGMGEVDMTEIIRLRKRLLEKEAEIGVRISLTDLIVLAMTKAIQHVPMVNSSLIHDEIKIWEDINVGIAVALDVGEYKSGLIVPVIRNADKKSLVEISRSIKDLTGRARSGKLTPDDVGGGTITLSNTGRFAAGWMVSTPVLNMPQAVIVQPGGVFEKPVAKDGQVVVRPIMTLSITFDHRILDGAPISKFTNKMVELLENPEFLLL